MPKKKTATKARAKKRPAKKAVPTKSRKKAKPADHLARAHRAVLRTVDSVGPDDRDAINRLRRLVEMAEANARTAKGR